VKIGNRGEEKTLGGICISNSTADQQRRNDVGGSSAGCAAEGGVTPESRNQWIDQGLVGWLRNPLHG
jgi:hypothetical protein